jgi:catechol 2,3-dioxygenase-like lactoylglutathione lyase family enzyme
MYAALDVQGKARIKDALINRRRIMSAQLSGILQIAISVENVERATAFYRDILELKHLMSGPNMAFFDCGGVRLYLASGAGAEHAGSNSNVYFRNERHAQNVAVIKGKESRNSSRTADYRELARS